MASSPGLFPVTPPLAARLRPQRLEDVIGQTHLVGPDGLLRRLIAAGTPQSLILWGPPGSGKTTLAQIYAAAFQAQLVQLSAVLAGVAEIRQAVAQAQAAQAGGQRTVLLIDEIHRFNKAQQDSLLPHVENGLFTLVGATTENPSFNLNNALLSRCTVLVVKSHSVDDLQHMLQHAANELGGLPLTPEAQAVVVQQAQGDARRLLNMLEVILGLQPKQPLDVPALETLLATKLALFDKGGDWHYNLISALHKSVRGSDADAALYYLARMLAGGADGLYIARRLVRMAVEDIGLADPHALPQALAAQQTYALLGSPEGELALAQTTLYLALSPKSNAVYTSYKAAQAVAAQTTALPPPHTILNAPTALMAQQGYGADYQYDHDAPDAFSGQHYWPENLPAQQFYQPVERGFERELSKRLAYFNRLRQARQTPR